MREEFDDAADSWQGSQLILPTDEPNCLEKKVVSISYVDKSLI